MENYSAIRVIIYSLILSSAPLLSYDYHEENCIKLHEAVRTNNILEVSKFLSLVDADCQDTKGRTALHIYAESPKKSNWIFLLLYSRGIATLNQAQFDGTTPLMTAITYENIDAINLLFIYDKPSNPVSINAQDKFGLTALHLAAIKNKPSLVSYLLNHGADQDITEKYGLTPACIAESDNSLELMESFKSYASNRHLDGQLKKLARSPCDTYLALHRLPHSH